METSIKTTQIQQSRPSAHGIRTKQLKHTKNRFSSDLQYVILSAFILNSLLKYVLIIINDLNITCHTAADKHSHSPQDQTSCCFSQKEGRSVEGNRDRLMDED